MKDSVLAVPVSAQSLAPIVTSDRWESVVVSLKLSQRERQIVECILGGEESQTLIAERLGISPSTVHTHQERLYRKLHVTSRSQLLASVFVAYASHGNVGSGK